MSDCPRCQELQGCLDLCAALSKVTSLNLQARIAQLELEALEGKSTEAGE